MKTVKITLAPGAKASRLELFIRFIWGTIVCIVLCIIGLFVCIAWCLQWIYMLVLGKRQPSLAKLINGWLVGWSQMMFYNNLATDERPPLFPEF